MASVIDPRWTIFSERGFKCSSCEKIHKGDFDLAYFRPDSWPGAESYEPNSALRFDGDFLSEDFCVIEGKHFLLRGVLEISVHGTGGETFGYGAWSTLSKENFKKYLQEFDSGGVGGTEWFGWFSNKLRGYPDSYALPCTVVTRPSRLRPKFVLENGDHPLVREQEAGISFDRLLEIYELHSHRFERL